MIPDAAKLLKFFRNPLNSLSVIGLVITAPILATFAVKGFFVRYIADDFCTAGSVVEHGWWGAQFHWYNSWSGRFSFTASITALEALGGWVAQVLPTLTIIGWLAALSWTLMQVLSRVGIAVGYVVAYCLSSLVLITYVITNPHPGQTFYWFTGNITYTLPLVLLTVAIGMAIKSLHNLNQQSSLRAYLRSRQAWWAVAAGGVFFMAASLNETYAVFQLAVIGLFLASVVLAQLQKRSFGYTQIVVIGSWICLSLLSTLIMYVAPGNAVRDAAFPDNPTISQTLEYALNATNTYLINDWQYAVYIYIFIISACLFTWALKQSSKSTQKENITTIVYQSVTILVIAYLLCVLVQAPSYYVQHYPTAARSLASMPFTLSVATLLIGYQMARAVNSIEAFSLSLLRPIIILALMAVGTKVLMSQTLYHVDTTMQQLPDLQQYATSWDRQSGRLIDLGQSQAGAATVGRLGHTFDLEDVSVDSSHWINQCMAQYYAIRSIWAE